jgi:hypothetical protein
MRMTLPVFKPISIAVLTKSFLKTTALNSVLYAQMRGTQAASWTDASSKVIPSALAIITRAAGEAAHFAVAVTLIKDYKELSGYT